jgi:hypothetical protein
MHTTRLTAGWLSVLLMVISAVMPAQARAKTDVIRLKNGDRITGEIKYLMRGMLAVKTDSMSTVEIKWPDVESITSEHLFTVQDTKGQLFVGSLQAAADPRHVSIAGPVPASDLEHLSVVEIKELEASMLKRFSGAVDLGYSFAKASSRTQFNFSGDITYLTERYSAKLDYSSTIGTSDGESDVNRESVNITGSKYFGRKWLAFAQMSYDHNLELQLDRRTALIAGPGYRVQQSNRSMVTLLGGAAFSRESYYGQDVAKNAEGALGIDAQFFKLYSPKVDVTGRFVYFPNFTTWGRQRSEFDGNVRIEVFRDFYVTFTLYDSYDSRPPSETATGNDYGFTTGLSWSFRR